MAAPNWRKPWMQPKRSGKTLVLDLLRWICRKAVLTSGARATTVVVFRLNEQCQPTFLFDEAEKLGPQSGNQKIIDLLNQGYRNGDKVYRCCEQKGGGGQDIEEFDASSYRAVAAIEILKDTLMDRSILISMQRSLTTRRCGVSMVGQPNRKVWSSKSPRK